MLSTALTVLYALIICLAVPTIISLELASRRAHVYAAPSTPWMRRLVIERLREEAAIYGDKPFIILELGAAWGTLALAAARACPQAMVIGYDLAGAPLIVARLRAFFGGVKNVRFIKADFYKEDLSQGDIVLTYLTDNLMVKLGQKAQREMRPGTVFICNTFGIRGWTPVRSDQGQNFLYKLKVYTYRLSDQN